MKNTKIEYHAAGGAVRDLLLGRSRRDVDYLCLGNESDFIQSNPGARKIENGNASLYLVKGQEYALLDAPEDERESLLEKDISRRDFTINAMLLSSDGLVRSHPDSFEDLRQGVIRPVSSSALFDDPIRVLRAARLSAELPGFQLHDDTLGQMRAVAGLGLLGSIAPEQAGNEFLKACLAPRPGNFLRRLHTTSALSPWFKELAHGGDTIAGLTAFHDDSILEHTAKTMDVTACLSRTYVMSENGNKQIRLAAWMALCNALGNWETPRTIPPRHQGQESRGADIARSLAERLRLPGLFRKAGKLAGEFHMKGGNYNDLRPGTKVDMLMALHKAGVALPFFLVVAADSGQVDLPKIMQSELKRILAVKLPSQKQNLGKASGEYLRQMRSAAITAV